MSALNIGQSLVSARTKVVYDFGFQLIQGVGWEGIEYGREVARSIREGRRMCGGGSCYALLHLEHELASEFLRICETGVI